MMGSSLLKHRCEDNETEFFLQNSVSLSSVVGCVKDQSGNSTIRPSWLDL